MTNMVPLNRMETLSEKANLTKPFLPSFLKGFYFQRNEFVSLDSKFSPYILASFSKTASQNK